MSAVVDAKLELAALPADHDQGQWAAVQARRLEIRRIIPCLDREAVGIVTGFDFAKLVAD